MCGLSGAILKKKAKFRASDLSSLPSKMLVLSSSRGLEATGISLGKESPQVLKKNLSASQFVKTKEFSRLVASEISGPSEDFVFMGHARLATVSAVEESDNIQPMANQYFIGIHNGIVTQLGEQLIQQDSLLGSDSKQLFEAIARKLAAMTSLENTMISTLQEMKGAASIALQFPQLQTMVLASNTGSLYYASSEADGVFFFGSEREFLTKTLRAFRELQHLEVQQLKSMQALWVDMQSTRVEKLDLDSSSDVKTIIRFSSVPVLPYQGGFSIAPSLLKRCQKCILPHTYPMIEFDQNGVCNFCRTYEKQNHFGEKALFDFLEPFRSRDGSPDCLVGLSGGRDSCYGLHLLKTRFGMNPIAYTFDWGLTTEVSRRNQARLCGQLGIEHIVRSANLEKKRSYVRKNVDAFLKKPHLGMVPLFMAGDKEFYEYGRRLKKENQLSLTVFCAGQSLEQREFMTGFCGVNENIQNNKRLFKFSLQNKLKLAAFYSTQYLINPAYINASLLDSFRSFLHSFVYKDDFLYLYEYIPWNESEIEKVLKSTYGWEVETRFGKNQWRMGDGQTAFTNYIYHAVAGFSEFDNFRSNQIREGMLARDEALRLVEEDNKPKYEMLKYFANVVGFNLDPVLKQIQGIPKLY